jgi:putative Holliday junction resolvase
MGKLAGVDYGKRRIGVAISDPAGRIASPATTLPGAGSADEDARSMLRWAVENEVSAIVVGLPVNMDGSRGPQARTAEEFAEQLRRHGDLLVELWDERLTSLQADQALRSAGLSSAKRRKRRDALAAQLILQSFLDARRSATDDPSAAE